MTSNTTTTLTGTILPVNLVLVTLLLLCAPGSYQQAALSVLEGGKRPTCAVHAYVLPVAHSLCCAALLCRSAAQAQAQQCNRPSPSCCSRTPGSWAKTMSSWQVETCSIKHAVATCSILILVPSHRRSSHVLDALTPRGIAAPCSSVFLMLLTCSRCLPWQSLAAVLSSAQVHAPPAALDEGASCW